MSCRPNTNFYGPDQVRGLARVRAEQNDPLSLGREAGDQMGLASGPGPDEVITQMAENWLRAMRDEP